MVPKKKDSKKHKKNKNFRKRNSHKRVPINKCHYCKDKIVALPHYCKFCGEKHCDKHLLPESHDCRGLNNDNKKWGGNYIQKNKDYEINPTKIISNVLESYSGNTPKNKTSHIKKKNNYEPQKKHKNKFLFKFFIFIILIGFAYFAYLNFESISSFVNNFGSDKEGSSTKIIDSETLKAFEYVNKYRADSGSQNLIYEEELYEWVKAVAEAKDSNPDSFNTTADFKSLIASRIDTSGMKYSFYTSYFIKGGGLEQFSREFDKKYSARNIIKDDKYNRGAVYCSLDYCVLFVFDNEGGLKEVENNIQPNSQIKVINKEDELITKCKQSYESCKNIATQKYDMSISLIRTEKVNDKSSAEEFYKTWKSPLQYGLKYELGGYSSNNDIENYLPIVLFATKVIGQGGQLPVVLICDSNGNLISSSKSQLLCG